MLAWWVIIPVGIFILVQSIVRWSVDDDLPTASPVFDVGYVTGGIFAGLAISLLVAWIVYRIAGRSQLAGTIAYSVMLAVFCLSSIFNTLVAPLTNAAIEAAAAQANPPAATTESNATSELKGAVGSKATRQPTATRPTDPIPEGISHPDHPLLLAVPEGWKQQENMPAPVLLMAMEPGTGNNLALLAFKAPSQDFVLKRDSAEEGVLEQLPNGKILHRLDTELAGVPAYCVIAESEVQGIPFRVARIMAEKPLGDYVYVLQYSKLKGSLEPESIGYIVSRVHVKPE